MRFPRSRSLLLSFLLLAWLGGPSVAGAATILNLGFTIQMNPFSQDPGGMDGASIHLQVRIDQVFYADLFGFAVATPSEVRMDVSGSTILANNGTFFYDPTFFLVAPNVNGTLWLLTDASLAGPQIFTWGETVPFGPIDPVRMTPLFRTAVGGAVGNPLPGATVIPQDYAGALLQNMVSRPINGGSFNATLTFSAVPGPSAALLLVFGGLALRVGGRKRP